MNVIARVKEILFAPNQAWADIETEETSTAELYTQYIMILAAIQAVAGFIGMSLFGIGASAFRAGSPGDRIDPDGAGLRHDAGHGLRRGADRRCPGTGLRREKNPLNALKLVAYSSTAAMVGGIFALIPALGVLILVAALYSLYLLYLGVPGMMKVPRERALPYTAVLVVCAIVLGVAFGAVMSMFSGGPAMSPAMAPGQVSIETPQGKVNIEARGGAVKIETPQGTVNVDVAKAEEWGKRMEAVGKKLEQAQQSGDQAAMDQALKEMAALQAQQPMATPGR